MATVLLSLLASSALGQEPKQPFVNRIVVEGNEYFTADNLKKQMKTKETGFFSIFFKPRLAPEVLRRDIAALRAYYHANGFVDAEVELKEIRQLDDPAFVDVVIAVVEGEAMRVEAIRFHESGTLNIAKLSKSLVLRQGVPFNPSTLESDVYTIKREYFERGHLAATVEDSVKTEGRRVWVDLYMTAGPVITIDDIRITGQAETKVSIIRKEFAFKSGEIFHLSRIVETQRNLLETGLFTVADIEPVNLNTTDRTVDIVVRLRERKSAYIEAGFGVGNIHGSRVIGEWGERNVFGTGRRIRFKVEYAFALFEQGTSTQIDQLDPRINFYRYDVEFGQRHVLGTKVNLGVNAFLEKDATVGDLVLHTLGASIGGNRRFRQYTRVLGGFSIERIDRSAPDLTTGNVKSNSHVITTIVNHDRRDFILDPKIGGYRDIKLQLGGGILGGDNDFYTISPTWQRYLRLSGTTLAVRARVGYADKYGRSTSVPVENRYFTGGSNSVRGYPENSLAPTDVVDSEGVPVETVVGGRVLMLTNAEWRFPLPFLSRYNFSGSMFFDGGNVWESVKAIHGSDFRLYTSREEVTQEDYRYSTGLGIRYNTPVGPIRLDYGIPIKREPDLRFARFHISLGQIF